MDLVDLQPTLFDRVFGVSFYDQDNNYNDNNEKLFKLLFNNNSFKGLETVNVFKTIPVKIISKSKIRPTKSIFPVKTIRETNNAS